MLRLRVNPLEIVWWVDLPELTSIRLGNNAFNFKDDESSELIMRSSDNEMKWWIDLPKLTKLTTEGGSSFFNPHSVTLEGISYHSVFINRHSLSLYCHSWQGIRFQKHENGSYQECHHPSSVMPRYHFRFAALYPISSFFHTQSTNPCTSVVTINIYYSNEVQLTTLTDHLNPSIKSHRIALPATVTNHSKYYILSIPYSQLHPFLLTNTHKRRIPWFPRINPYLTPHQFYITHSINSHTSPFQPTHQY